MSKLDKGFNYDDSDLLLETVITINGGSATDQYELNDDECIFCCFGLKNQYVITLKCHHAYHRNCILKYMINYGNSECPQCKVFNKSTNQQVNKSTH